MFGIRNVVQIRSGVALLAAVFPAIILAQGLSLPNGTSLVSQQELVPPLASALQAMGGRLQTSDKAQITLNGTITDAAGSRSAQITIQAPGYLAYREGTSRAITFDGTSFQTKAGSLSASDEAIGESLLAHFPDAIFLQLAFGGCEESGRIFGTTPVRQRPMPDPIGRYTPFLPNLELG